jgi:hypothetical protein
MIDPKCLVFVAAGAFTGLTASAAAQAPAACRTPEHRQFDFWVGDWTVRWIDSQGQVLEGRNRIRKTLDDCVVVEEFDGRPGAALRGMSVSTYDAKAARWHQTWVDNSGGYLAFEGGMDAGRMVLVRRAVVDGRTVLQRMVFRDMTADALVWDWQRSSDDGVTWTTAWQILYRRRAP